MTAIAAGSGDITNSHATNDHKTQGLGLAAATSRVQGGGLDLMQRSLPTSPFTSIGELLQIFDHTTNSYKYLFFLSLLEQIQNHSSDSAPQIAVRAVIEGALAMAWYPHVYFKLSFGSQDQIGKILSATPLPEALQGGRLTPLDLDSVRAAIHQQLSPAHYKQLSRWVQFRLLSPWFRQELRGLKDSAKNATIATLSHQYFHEKTPLYRLEGRAGEVLQLHPDWVSYIRRNHTPLRDWALWQWLAYMQSHNPAIPNVAGKLLPPVGRASLHKQRKYWAQVIAAGGVTCVFTRKPVLTLEALDHFLPWSFVLHDRLWNLAPVSTTVNSSKSNHLPDLQFLPRLASLDFSASTPGSRAPRNTITTIFAATRGLVRQQPRLERGIPAGFLSEAAPVTADPQFARPS